MLCPIMKDDLSLQKNATAPATSSAVPTLFNGTVASKSTVIRFLSKVECSGFNTVPGTTQLTRIPLAPRLNGVSTLNYLT